MAITHRGFSGNRWLVVLAALALAAAAGAAIRAVQARRVHALEELMQRRQYGEQMCAGIDYGSDHQFPLYRILRDFSQISPGDFRLVREQRALAIRLIRDSLTQTLAGDVAALTEHQGIEIENELAHAIDLNASDLMPQVLTVARRTRFACPAADASREYVQNMPAQRLYVASLSTLTGLLSQEAYQPIVDSEWERNRVASMEAETARWGESYWWWRYNVEITPEVADQIEAWCEDFLATVPPERRRGAAGMAPDPVAM